MQHVPELCVHQKAFACPVHGTWLAIEQLLQIVFPWASDGNEDDRICRNDGPLRILGAGLFLDVMNFYGACKLDAGNGNTLESVAILRRHGNAQFKALHNSKSADLKVRIPGRAVIAHALYYTQVPDIWCGDVVRGAHGTKDASAAAAVMFPRPYTEGDVALEAHSDVPIRYAIRFFRSLVLGKEFVVVVLRKCSPVDEKH